MLGRMRGGGKNGRVRVNGSAYLTFALALVLNGNRYNLNRDTYLIVVDHALCRTLPEPEKRYCSRSIKTSTITQQVMLPVSPQAILPHHDMKILTESPHHGRYRILSFYLPSSA